MTNNADILKAAAIFIDDKGRLLISKDKGAAKWTILGGRIEDGETQIECLHREIKEELDMQMDINKVVGIYTSPNYVLDFGGNKVFQPFVVAFLCTPKSKKFRINKESTEAKWFNIDKISELDLFPNTENIINQALNKKQTHFD